MRAAVYRRFGGPEVVRVEEVPKPTAGPGDVLIRVHASTVSAADHRARSKNVPKGLGLAVALALGIVAPRKRILGMDVAGVVEAVGADVTLFAPGDEVIAMLGGSFGGHAEYVCIAQRAAITAKPRNLGFDESVALVFGGVTAHAFLGRASIGRGDSVLVNGASGAVGTAAVQLARVLGARVTAVCSAANGELVARLGAWRAIDYTASSFLDEARSYEVIVDCVGDVPFERLAERVRPAGALLLVVADLRATLLSSSRGSWMGKFISSASVEYSADALRYLVGLAESGQYQPVVDRTYALDEIVEAHRYVDTGRKKGNVVLRLASPPTTPNH